MKPFTLTQAIDVGIGKKITKETGSRPTTQLSDITFKVLSLRGRGKTGKIRVKRKWFVLADSLFPARKREAVTHGQRPPNEEENQGSR